MNEIGSLSCRVCLYMAANPGSKLDTEQIAEKFHGQFHRVANALRLTVNAGYLKVERKSLSPKPGSINVYSEGPQIGRFRGA
jgi:hypothetical protein